MNEKPKSVVDLEHHLKLVVGMVSASPKCNIEEAMDACEELARVLHNKRNAYVLIACGVCLLRAIETEDEALDILREAVKH